MAVVSGRGVDVWAHSKNDFGARHGLVEHLRSTSALAHRFAAPFGAGELAGVLGLLHDAGKADCGWQQRLIDVEGTAKPVGGDHKGLGTQMAVPLAGPAAMAILGHHGGLTDRGRLVEETRKAPTGGDATRARLLAAIPEASDVLAGPRLLPASWSTPLVLDMGVRMTFSALVDADHLDTAAHFAGRSGPEVGAPADMRRLVERFEAGRIRMLRDRLASPVDGLRNELYRSAVGAAAGSPGLYRLPAPTGSGKTMTAAAFALHHAAANGQARVIVAVPFVTITEQNAQVYRELLGDVVLEHHSGTEMDDRRSRLAAENWDAPFVVTTTVQLFDSLFGRMPARSRKLHRLANAVIVLDEVQSLPIPLLVPILDGLRLLVEHFGSTVLLASATQPAFEHLQVWQQRGIVDIVENPAAMYAQLRRARYEWWLDPQPTEVEVADRVACERQALVVVNTTRAAREMFGLIAERAGRGGATVRHLSTRMCPAHRRVVLAEVRELLAADEPAILVSTQLIEAGVDVDFPVVYRALAPADSLQQAAGRANREGRRPEPGRVIVFADGSALTDYRVPVGRTMLCFGPGKADPDDLDALKRYYQHLYDALNTDAARRATCIQEHRAKLDFLAVAEGPLDNSAGSTRRDRSLAFRMLDDDTVPVVVTEFDRAADRLLDDLRNGGTPRRATFRALQRYLVSLPRRVVDRPEVRALCRPVLPDSDLLEWRGRYDEHHGIDEGATAEENIW